MMQPLPRRRFIKGLFLGTVTSTFLNKPWSGAYAAEYSSAEPGTGIVRLNIQDYPPIQEPFGSVRIGVNPIEFGEGAPQGRFYPIIVNRGENDEFFVLDSTCAHAACVVRAYETSESSMRCACHGSRYSLQGDVIEGPAEEGLQPYQFTREGDLLSIQVPGLAYKVALSRVNDPSDRVRLDFFAFGFVEFEVRFREKITDPWTVVPFARTPNGPISQTVFVGEDTPTSLFAERSSSTGFFSVAMRVQDLTGMH